MENPTKSTKDKSPRLLSDKETFALDSYLVNGRGDEAYLFSRTEPTSSTREDMIHRMALRWLRQDEVKKYLSDRRASMFGDSKDRSENSRIDYTDKDALLQELARIAERSEKDSDRLSALKEIGSLQRMKMEQITEEEKRVAFYIPLSVDRCLELFGYLLGKEFDWSDEEVEKAIGIMRKGYDGRN